MGEFIKKSNRLFCSLDNEVMEIESWGHNGLRVRCTQSSQIKPDWISALINQGDHQASIEIHLNEASIQNGDIKGNINSKGELAFINVKDGKELLKEKPIHPISIPARAYKNLKGDLFHIDCCFEAYDDEHIYGLGQHQHGRLDQKGCVIELIHRNTEVSIPFLFSSRGYGFLWNNPAVGRVELGYNATRWVAEAAPQME